jgi:N-methylhydantoinase B
VSILENPTPSTAGKPRLRELSDDEFGRAYGCDRFTATVILSRLRYVMEHMSTGFLREAFSPIIRDWYDFACTISGPPESGYPMAVVSNSLMVFLGTMADAVRNAVEEFGPENLSPGDVLICNDPYRTGTHVNDVVFIRPIFVNGRLVSFVNVCAHQLDMGGPVPGGFAATKSTVYENGLVIPPVLMWAQDKPVRSTFSLVFDNARFAGLLLPDFKSVFEQLKLGEQLVQQNIARYGPEAFLGTLAYACDTSAERIREAIARIPDGDYVGTSLIDADGKDDSFEYVIKVTLRKRGHDIEADFSGSSAQARTCVNAGILDTKTSLGVGLTMLLDPEAPFTSGTWRNIDLVAPPGTNVSSLPPDGSIFFYWEIDGAIVSAIFDALNPVLGVEGVGGDYGSTNTHQATGQWDDGTPWASATQCGGEHGPWGATKEGDADSYTVAYTINNLDTPTETIEHDVPVVLLRKEHAIDTGGPGTYRGGAAHLKDTLWLRHAEQHITPLRSKAPSGVGANGGAPGPTGGAWFFASPGGGARPEGLVGTSAEVYGASVPIGGVLDPETKTLDPDGGTYHYFASQPVWRTEPGTVLRVLTNGGGGWGNPFERDPQRVLADVRDEYVSIDGAARDYGVVVVGDPHNDPEGLRIDEDATTKLRSGA